MARINFRVNAISFWIIVTLINQDLPHIADPEQRKQTEALHLLGLGNPEDIANACIYLLSDAQEQDRGVYLHLFHGIHKHLEPERLLKVGKSAITLARAQQITRSMYQLTYALPQSGHVKTTLLRKADVDKDDKYRRIACDNAVAVLIDYIDKIISRIP